MMATTKTPSKKSSTTAVKKPVAKKASKTTTKPSRAVSGDQSDMPARESDKVDAFIAALKGERKSIVAALRKIIVDVDPLIGEHIKWNHPAYFFSGPMKPFDPKSYKRHMIVFNLHSKDGSVLLVVLRGDAVDDKSGFLTGDYADGRRLARFHTLDDVKAGAPALRKVSQRWVKRADA